MELMLIIVVLLLLFDGGGGYWGSQPRLLVRPTRSQRIYAIRTTLFA
jgi:hypothetical protein